MIITGRFLRAARAVLLVTLLAACGESPDQAAPAGGGIALGRADVERYLEDVGCLECHGRDEMRIGPSYEAIALRYAEADARTLEVLAQKIVLGGAGNWGVVPMVPNPQVGLDQSRAIVEWIIGLGASR